ncbi:MAG: PSD1 and planctomycete cytochrome C domain-containing protein [Planctomycetaceae bacterium]|nr:PSD1 and planctomycete cytochrome C domain-containing protein [Planctomycetaceae bacterium]
MSARVAAALTLVVALAAAAGVHGLATIDPRGGVRFASVEPDPVSFDRAVRPILSEKCFHCHGVDAAQRKAGLRLDERDSALASRAIVPGRPGLSALVARIRSTDIGTVMPPPESHRALDDTERRLLERWIAEGARYEPHWAYVPPTSSTVAGERTEATESMGAIIDALVGARLAREGLALSPEADRTTLLRRVTLDLTGLPPTEAEVEAFVADRRPDAYERVVDRLLASPRYGEKQALPWLDAARYADSNGFQQDGDTFQWMWRDWLVRSLNEDMPFDRMSTWMLAGDLVEGATDASRVATAFLRNHLLNGEGGAIPEENRWIAMFDRVDATATTWLGLTASCAQCHDHKYDPITQRDYYALLDAFNRVPESGIVDHADGRFRLARPWIEPASDAQRARRAELEAAVAAAGDDAARRDPVRAELDRFLREEWPRVMTMSDDATRETRILSRGEYLAPGEKVAFATPAFLPPLPPGAPRDRLGLARWLFMPDNPLVARVAVNRAWQVFFGDGLVRTPEDFGVQGDRPIHQDVLDTLAVRFREDGWSMKRLHRWIVTSRTYRQSSHASAEILARDPDNRLLARAPRFRMPAMVLRDMALAASGLLVEKAGGAPVYPLQPTNVWEPLAITKERDFTYPTSSGADLHRRSIYTFWRRTIAPANMFDASQRQRCTVRATVTASPLHALTMLNDPTWTEAAGALAARVAVEADNDGERLARAFEHVTAREPEPRERAALEELLASQRALLSDAAHGADTGAGAGVVADPALAAACLAILNLDEAMTRE